MINAVSKFLKIGVLMTVFLLSACTPNADKSPDINKNTHTNTQESTQNNAQTPTALNDTRPIKVMTPDWGVAMNLLALDIIPVAIGEVRNYDEWVAEPALPKQVIDLGLRFTPNSELLARLVEQGLIEQVIDTEFYAQIRPQYKNISLTTVDFNSQEMMATWDGFAGATWQIAKTVNKQAQAQIYITRTKDEIRAIGERFTQRNPSIRSLAVVQFVDENNLRLYGQSSIFYPATKQMGLSLVIMGQSNQWGFVPITLNDLAKLPKDSCLLIVKPYSAILQQNLQNNAIWQRLGFGKTRCMGVLEPIWMYGGVPSLHSFAKRLDRVVLMGVSS